ncbi:MAG TPA: hypothetical protein VEU07_02580 [Candidatus Acidoferrum sp.]|nr:hypothetical protein [Candidatus Acidoferrum sp.]
MPLGASSRWFLVAALVHLGVAAALLMANEFTEVLTVNWDVLLWVLLPGFIGSTTLGFALHLFPTLSHRPLPRGRLEVAAFLTAQIGIAAGAVALYLSTSSIAASRVFSLSAAIWAVSVLVLAARFGRTALQPELRIVGPESRPGDAVTIPLFLMAWASAGGAGILFALSGYEPGPGFGWWISAVHLFVLGHAALLITAVSLRLVPRSLGSDPPRWAVISLAGLGVSGAILVPTGMLLEPPAPAWALEALAAPEAAYAGLFFALLVFLGLHATTPRRPLALHLTAVAFLLLGGGPGLWMVSGSNYAPVVGHASLNVIGFIGLTVLFMWFGLLAPFQRISHDWTQRMLWVLGAAWVAAIAVLVAVGLAGDAAPGWLVVVGGSLLLAIVVAWAVGTIPVLYPGLNPLPGISSEAIHKMLGDRRRP